MVVDSAGQPVTVIETVAVRVLRLAGVDLAYHAIRAVESAAHATIEPNNAKATLGTMLGQFRNALHVYRIAIPGPDGSGSITPLTAMMELLWTGQTSRHAARHPSALKLSGRHRWPSIWPRPSCSGSRPGLSHADSPAASRRPDTHDGTTRRALARRRGQSCHSRSRRRNSGRWAQLLTTTRWRHL